MKTSFLKITTCILFAAASLATTSVSRAADAAATPTTTEAAGPAKFYGPVSAVDTNKMTFTVGDQTFTVTSESHLTKAGNAATLADAVVGEPARGSYTTGKDGKLDITKTNFGKKAGGKSGGKAGGKGGKKKTDGASADTTPAKE
ncbi:MAG: hypothetical protein JF609_09295 [Verrucomicrobia bacterium]|nr:hypothetical protein [Verrucomicrobiota bacterium]